MKKLHHQCLALATLIIGAFPLQAGTLFYVPIPASESDPNSGISSENTYTTAVDGGNAQGTDRVINGITLYALTGEGQSISANNCYLNALEGTIANGGGAAGTIRADGTVSEVASDMTFNNEASDGSQQEIVLDPASLTAGTTYDLRVYICNPSGQNREVNLTFAGDGEAPVETGWFNEDDATSSAGGFQDPNQVYYIDYRYTWDGDTTPGITISQRYGRTPFCLYALTNQVVSGEEAGAQASSEAAAPAATDEGLTTGLVTATSDEVGVTSDTFYSDDSLNSNGEWVDVASYGKCWRPTRVSSDWRPYTNGNWRHCDDCGWTWNTDEEWGWATYHYGRWCHTVDTGWCWVPGKVWSPAWVSWRRGAGPDCSCVGWAPLPPEAGCDVNVGVGSWVDRICGIGPDAYTFVNVVDFGSDNYSRCGQCLIDRGRYVNIFEHTTNCTNISYVNVVNQTNIRNVNIYNGGPDYSWCNSEIRKHGGKEVPQIHVNRYDDPSKIKGGKRSHLEGNTLALTAPKITPTKNPKHAPKIAATVPKEKIDKGWNAIKDPKIKNDLKNKIAQETKGLTPKNAPAKLPPDVASQIAKGAGAPGMQGQKSAAGKGLPKGAVLHQAGAKAGQGRGAGQLDAKKGLAAQPGTKLGKPGEPDARKGIAAPPGAKVGQVGKPGQRAGQKASATPSQKAADTGKLGAPDEKSRLAGQGSMRPGQSLKKTGRGQAGISAQKKEGAQGTKQGAQAQGLQPGKPGIQGKAQGVQQGQAEKGLQPGKAGQSTAEQKGQGVRQGKATGAGVAKEPGTRSQGAKKTQEAKSGQAAQREGETDQALKKQQQQRQVQQQQAQQGQKLSQQKAVQQQQKVDRQQQEARQEKQLQQQKQAQQQKQQRQTQQEQKQLQEKKAQQEQKQLQQRQAQEQKRLQQQQAQQQQKQLQQQQAQQEQKRLQLQQAQQQQKQLQQQQAQQQQRQPVKKGKPTPTPTPTPR